MNALPVPQAALRDDDSVEMVRVWIAEQGLHCALKVGIYNEGRLDERKAWGVIFADAARHVASALEKEYGFEFESALANIRQEFNAELNNPTTPISGDFVARSN